MTPKPQRPQHWLRRFILFAETYSVTVPAYVLLFLCISYTRNFIEGAFESAHTLGTNASFETAIMQMGVLFNLEWVTLLCALALVLHFLTKEKLVPVLKILLVFYAWIIVVPFIDLLFYASAGCKIDYLYTLSDYIKALLYFFSPVTEVKVCAGIRFEVFASFFFIGFYVFYKTHNIIKAVSASLLLYVLTISSMAFPVFILLPVFPFLHTGFDLFVNTFFFGTSYAGGFLSRTSLLIFLFLFPMLFIMFLRHYGLPAFKHLLKLFFSPFALLFSAAFFAGFVLAPQRPGTLLFANPMDYAYLLVGCLLPLFFGLYAGLNSTASKIASLAVPIFILILMPALALSTGIFLSYVFICALCVFLYNAPFHLSRSPLIQSVAYALFIFIFYVAGTAAIKDISVFNNFNPVFPGLLSLAVFALSRLRENAKNISAICLLIVVYAFTPVLLVAPLLFIPAILAIVLTLFYIYKARSKNNITEIFSLIFLVFIIATVLIKK